MVSDVLKIGVLNTLDSRIRSHEFRHSSPDAYWQEAARICQDPLFQALVIKTPSNVVLYDDQPSRAYPPTECCIGNALVTPTGSRVEDSPRCDDCALCELRPQCAARTAAYEAFVNACASATTATSNRFLLFGFNTHEMKDDIPNLVSFGLPPVDIAAIVAGRLLAPSSDLAQLGISALSRYLVLQERAGFRHLVYVSASATSEDRSMARIVYDALRAWDDVRAPVEATALVFNESFAHSSPQRLVVVGDYSAEIADAAGASVYMVVANAQTLPYALDSVSAPAYDTGQEMGRSINRYIPTPTAPSLMNVRMQVSKPSCRCLSWDEVSHYMAPVATTAKIRVEIGGVEYLYDRPYGFGGCSAWDAGRPPKCDSTPAPSYCASEWCYVTSECATGIETSHFAYHIESLPNPSDRLLYSYAHCGALDDFTTSGTPYAAAPSAAQVALARRVVPRYVVPSTDNVTALDNVPEPNTLLMLVDRTSADQSILGQSFVLQYDRERSYSAASGAASDALHAPCRCLDWQASVLNDEGLLRGLWDETRNAPFSYTDPDSLAVTLSNGSRIEYDRRYGFEQCDGHDSGRAGCDSDLYDCEARWCYVNPECHRDITSTDYYAAFFDTLASNKNLFYSYAFCDAPANDTYRPLVMSIDPDDPTAQAVLMQRACTTPNVQGIATTVASADASFQQPIQSAIDYCRTHNQMAQYPFVVVNTMTIAADVAYVGTPGAQIGKTCARHLFVDESDRAARAGATTSAKSVRALSYKMAVYAPPDGGMIDARYQGFVQELTLLHGANATAANVRRCDTRLAVGHALEDGFATVIKMTTEVLPFVVSVSCATLHDTNALNASGVDLYTEGAQSWTTLVARTKELRTAARDVRAGTASRGATCEASVCVPADGALVFGSVTNTANCSYLVSIGGTTYAFPASYGMGCAAHDLASNPLCAADAPPAWCSKNWTYVLPTTSCASEVSSYLTTRPGLASIVYSYAQCGDTDCFSNPPAYKFATVATACTQHSDCTRKFQAVTDSEVTGFDDRVNSAMRCVDNACRMNCSDARRILRQICAEEVGSCLDPETSCPDLQDVCEGQADESQQEFFDLMNAVYYNAGCLDNAFLTPEGTGAFLRIDANYMRTSLNYSTARVALKTAQELLAN